MALRRDPFYLQGMANADSSDVGAGHEGRCGPHLCPLGRSMAGSIAGLARLVVPQSFADFAAENPIGPSCVHQDDGQQEQRAN